MQNISDIKEKYKVGTKLRLKEDLKDDYRTIKAGEKCIVEHIDDIGTIHVVWENGSTLGLLTDIDNFEIIEKIKVVMVEVNKKPYVKIIDNTLEDKQALVGGNIQSVPTLLPKFHSFDFICNEDGKSDGLPYNRYIFNNRDAIAGDFIAIKFDKSTGDYITMTDEEAKLLCEEIEKECPVFNYVDYFKDNFELEVIEI